MLILFYLSAVAAEIVYLDDITGDHDKRNLRQGLPENMQFRVRRIADDLVLNLRENKHLNPNAPVYGLKKDIYGNDRIMRNTNIKPIRNVRYYQGYDNDAYIKAECVNGGAGPCTRLLTGNILVNGREHSLVPAIDELNKRELNSDQGTPHQLEHLVMPERILEASQYDEKRRINQTRPSVKSMRETRDKVKTIANQYVAEKLLRKKRASQVAHGIQLYLAIDHTVYNDFAQLYNGEDAIKYKIREYFCHIVNGVDLRYASVQDPSFTIYVAIVGFYISTKESESPWMNYNEDPTKGNEALASMVNWRKRPGIPEHDHVALMTRSDIAYKDWVTDDIIKATTGMAVPDGICTDLRVSVNEDHGFFQGASILAHEIAHSLGLKHDDDIAECNNGELYIMSLGLTSEAATINQWRFSKCSMESFRKKFENFGGFDCTLNPAVIDDDEQIFTRPDELAGQLYSLDDQCVLLKGIGASYCRGNPTTADICKNFTCKAAGGKCEPYAVADGTPCGNGQVCFESTCQIPDVCTYRPLGSNDIAKNFKNASQSSEDSSTSHPASFALDGSLDTISLTSAQDDPWWSVEFSSPRSVFAVKLWNRKDCCSDYLGNLKIRVDGTLCGQLSGPLPLGSCIEVSCINGPIQGSVLEIQQMKKNTPLNIAEVQVFDGCRLTPPEEINIATDYMAVSQSSENVTEPHPAALALDGSLNTFSYTNAQDNQWWKLEFSSQKSILAVKLWNREDCCGDKLGNLQITVDGTSCGHVTGPLLLGSCFKVTCADGPILGSILKIQQMKQSTPLNIAEVQVFGGCLAPAVVPNSIRSPIKSVYFTGDVLTYRCDSCYEHTGDLVRQCTSNGSWTGTSPVCTDKAYYMLNTQLRYKNVTQSSQSLPLQPATLALDGSHTTVSQTDVEAVPSWQLDFCTVTNVSSVHIWCPKPYCPDGVSSLRLKVDSITCQYYESHPHVEDNVEITCQDLYTGGLVSGKSLEISRTESQSALTLAEVTISVARPCPAQEPNKNIAVIEMYVRATQSSESSPFQPAILALDGDRNTVSVTGINLAPWWEIIFCRTMTIGRVQILNRRDCCPERMKNISVSVDGQFFGFYQGPAAADAYVDITALSAMPGTRLRITRQEIDATILNMADVQIFDV